MEELVKYLKVSTNIKVGGYFLLGAVAITVFFNVYKNIREIKLTNLRINELETKLN